MVAMKVKGLKLTPQKEAYLDVWTGLAKNTMTDQESIALLVKSGLSQNAEHAKQVISNLRGEIFKSKHPEIA